MIPSTIEDRDLWESYANDHPEYYVDTEFFKYPRGKRREKFFELGKEFTNKTMARVNSLLPDKNRALEIGAGVGRLTIPHAQYFDEVIAIDVSPTMLKELKRNADKANRSNIKIFLPEESWDTYQISYAYSYIVLQHIVDFEVIKDYIKKISACLKKGGIAQFQFDTRKPNILYHIRNSLPDLILPKTQRKGVRRIRRDAATLRTVFVQNNLEIVKEISPDSTLHTYILKKKEK